ncbi:hypothetical protein XELAEV_18040620mg [Xenopus laevis]|uniref:Immunoglobulin V-set domain-containing protein n=1 Tax=Xenopus laevis TaxID=8355 RepID=A0A974H984_XENLA|nr:hypothetical protein XELAEV_18040620mg [Xenopus laevis]
MVSLFFQSVILLCVLKNALCFDCNMVHVEGEERGAVTLLQSDVRTIYKLTVYTGNKWQEIFQSGKMTNYGKDRYKGRLSISNSRDVTMTNLRMRDAGTYKAITVEYDMVLIECYQLKVTRRAP